MSPRVRTLLEEADELLREDCRERGLSAREAGWLDTRRRRTVRHREVPFAAMGHTLSDSVYDLLRELPEEERVALDRRRF